MCGRLDDELGVSPEYFEEADAIADAVADIPSRPTRIDRIRGLLRFGAEIDAIRDELGWWPDRRSASADSRRFTRDMKAARDA